MVTEKDRDAAVRRLRDAYADGHVTHEEMDGLLHRLLTAGTRGELRAAPATLPEEDPGATAEIAAAAGSATPAADAPGQAPGLTNSSISTGYCSPPRPAAIARSASALMSLGSSALTPTASLSSTRCAIARTSVSRADTSAG